MSTPRGTLLLVLALAVPAAALAQEEEAPADGRSLGEGQVVPPIADDAYPSTPRLDDDVPGLDEDGAGGAERERERQRGRQRLEGRERLRPGDPGADDEAIRDRFELPYPGYEHPPAGGRPEPAGRAREADGEPDLAEPDLAEPDPAEEGPSEAHRRLRGELAEVRPVELGDGAGRLFELRFADGRRQLVFPAEGVDLTALRPGARVVISGQEGALAGRRLLLLESLEVDRGDRRAQAKDGEARRPRAEVVVRGTVLERRAARGDDGAAIELLRVRLRNGRDVAVVVEPGARARAGDEVEVRGRPGRLDGRTVLIGERVGAPGAPTGEEEGR